MNRIIKINNKIYIKFFKWLISKFQLRCLKHFVTLRRVVKNLNHVMNVFEMYA